MPILRAHPTVRTVQHYHVCVNSYYSISGTCYSTCAQRARALGATLRLAGPLGCSLVGCAAPSPAIMGRFLFLHGFGESSLVASMSAEALGNFVKSKGARPLLVFIISRSPFLLFHLLTLRAPHATLTRCLLLCLTGVTLDASMDGFIHLKTAEDMLAIHDEEYKQLCQAGDLDAYCWYRLEKNRTEGGHRAAGFEDFGFRGSPSSIADAVDLLIKHIDKLGDVEALVGFSQGGELAYLVAEQFSRLSAKSQQQLCFVGTFGSEDSFNKRGSSPSPLPANLRFLICFGDGDPDAVHDSATTAKALTAAGAAYVKTLQVKGLDHHMPKEGDGAYTVLWQIFSDAKAAKPIPGARPSPPPTVAPVPTPPPAATPAATGAASAAETEEMVVFTIRKPEAAARCGVVLIEELGKRAAAAQPPALLLLAAAGYGFRLMLLLPPLLLPPANPCACLSLPCLSPQPMARSSGSTSIISSPAAWPRHPGSQSARR